jgi:hypothetical protein
MSEIQAALSLGNYDSTINGIETWVFSKWSTGGNGDNDFCHSFLYGSGHIGVKGTSMKIDLDSPGGSNGVGTRVAFFNNKGCGSALKILCCR